MLYPAELRVHNFSIIILVFKLFKEMLGSGFEPNNSDVYIDRLPTSVICNRTAEQIRYHRKLLTPIESLYSLSFSLSEASRVDHS